MPASSPAVRFKWPSLSTALAWLLILALGGAVGWWQAENRQEEMRAEMRDTAARCALAFATEDVAQLLGTPDDLGTPPYHAVKSRLQQLRAIDQSARFLYLFRTTDEPGRVIFLADSEPAGSPEESQPGDPYPEAPNSPGLQEILRTGRPATEGPLGDSFGNWVTAYASAGNPPPGAPRIVLGLDVDASDWSRERWQAGLIGATYTWFLLGLPFAGWRVLRREARYNRDIIRFSAAIQQSHSGILITDLDRRIEYANTGCAVATGYTMAELLGQPVGRLLPPEMETRLREGIRTQVLAGERWQGELELQRQNGERFPVRLLVSPVRAGDHRITGLVLGFDDIADFKRTEDELRIARDQAQSADRAKGEFLAMMSHELRTPLNGIIGFASLLGDTPLSAEQKDYTETIRRSGEALLALTNELLDYSRIDAGRLRLDPQPCSPRLVVEETVELLSTRAAEKHLELVVAVAPSVPAHVLADPGRLRQILVNLVGNAIKFTPAGEVEVLVGASPLPPADGSATPRVQLEFSVRDTGIGIAPEQRDRLFRPFSQVDASSTRKHGGAGLGLAISRSLVQLMEGDIAFQSLEGSGSVFRFHLPVPVLEAALPLAALPARQVALVCSNRCARTHYSALLRGWGLQVTAVENLPALPAGTAFDVLLLDVVAQDAELWTGLIQTHPALAAKPVIGFVPLSVPGAVRDALRASFRAVLKKPLREPLLHAVLQTLFRGETGARTPTTS